MHNIPQTHADGTIIDNLSKEEQNRFHVLYELGWADIYVEEEDRDTSVYVSKDGFDIGGEGPYTYLILGSYDDENGEQMYYGHLTNNHDAYEYWKRLSEGQGD